MPNIILRAKVVVMMSLALTALCFSCGDHKTTINPGTPPARPGNLRATALSPTSILLQWDDNSDNEIFFWINRAERGPFATYANTAANENAFVDTLAEDSTFYRYYVIATNLGGMSDPTDTVGVTTPAPGFAPVAPQFPSPANDSTGVPIDVTLMWQCADPDGDSLTYAVYFGTGAYLNPADSGLTSPSYTPDSLEYGTLYNWKVVAWDDDRHHTDGAVWHFTTGDSAGADTSFVIDMDVSGQGHVTFDPDLPRFDPGDSVTLTAVPNGGWYFWGWTGDTTGTENPLILKMTHDYSIVANFEEVADSTTTRIRGVVTWPGHPLSPHVYAFADTSHLGLPWLVAQANVDPSDGRFEIVIPDQADTLLLEFQGQDDVNGNGPWEPIDPVDGWGHFDPDGDTLRDDFFLIAPGTHMDSVWIVLREHGR